MEKSDERDNSLDASEGTSTTPDDTTPSPREPPKLAEKGERRKSGGPPSARHKGTPRPANHSVLRISALAALASPLCAALLDPRLTADSFDHLRSASGSL